MGWNMALQARPGHRQNIRQLIPTASTLRLPLPLDGRARLHLSYTPWARGSACAPTLSGHPETRDQRVAQFATAKVLESDCKLAYGRLVIQLHSRPLGQRLQLGKQRVPWLLWLQSLHDQNGHHQTRMFQGNAVCTSFAAAVKQARAEEEFTEPTIITEHFSVQYLVTRRRYALMSVEQIISGVSSANHTLP